MIFKLFLQVFYQIFHIIILSKQKILLSPTIIFIKFIIYLINNIFAIIFFCKFKFFKCTKIL